jgi:hypothetical protein
MGARTNIPGATNLVLQEAISAYSDEAYTNAKKLSGTGVVGSNPNIDKNSETFVGQVRWYKPMNPVINVASLTDPADGTKTNYASDFLNYVKTVRTHGAEKVNMAQVVTQEDGLAKIGRDFGETRAQDEHNAILAVLKGVALSEAIAGVAAGSGVTGLGGQTFDNDPANKAYGMYVDLGNTAVVTAAAAGNIGAARAQGFLDAFGMAFKDYEPDYAYLVTSPAVVASLRSANLVDSEKVSDGSVNFETIFGGKFRIIQSRANQSFSAADLIKINTGAGVDILGGKTSFIVLPGAIAMESLNVPDQTEITRNGNTHNGGGSTSIWHRWGYVAHPAGYNWLGSQDAFPSDADYGKVIEGVGTASILPSAVVSGTFAATTGTWERKASSALSLGILPVFHA